MSRFSSATVIGSVLGIIGCGILLVFFTPLFFVVMMVLIMLGIWE